MWRLQNAFTDLDGLNQLWNELVRNREVWACGSTDELPNSAGALSKRGSFCRIFVPFLIYGILMYGKNSPSMKRYCKAHLLLSCSAIAIKDIFIET